MAGVDNISRSAMSLKDGQERKVVIAGAGDVGSTFAYTLAQSGLADSIYLLDINRDLVQGQVMDLAHGLPYFPAVKIQAGDQDDYADARIIVITAGAKQQRGEKRLDLIQRNSVIIKSIMDDIKRRQSQAVIVMVTNPVDVLTYLARHYSGFDRRRIIGSGTVLDSARFRFYLSRHCKIDVHNVHAYILGEHGDSEFAAWSLTHLAGMPIDIYCQTCRHCQDWTAERDQIVKKVRDSAYHIIDYKGATCYAIGQALLHITRAVLRDQKSVLTVSTILEGEYGLRDVCLSVPVIVGKSGMEAVVEAPLPDVELEQLKKSALIIQEVIGGVSN
jgi:L-lactate dehydrogenase